MSDVRLTAEERETILACDCGHDIHEHNYLGCYASDYYPDRQVRCTCTETDARPAVNFAAVERILAARLADRDAAGVETLREMSDAATPGNWFVEYAGDFGDKHAIVADVLRGRYGNDALNFGEDYATAEFVAAAVNFLRAALSGPADAHPADGTGA